MISQHQRSDDYTALSDRMGYLLILRLSMAAVTIAWAAMRPEALGTPFTTLLAITGVYVGIAAASEIVRRRMRHGHMAMSLALLVDGVFLAYAMYITGATQSPLRFLIYLHLVAVSLLASYRTGLKVALWHSLLLFVVLYAQAAMLVPPVDVIPGRAIDFDRMPVLNVTSFWLFALATSVFSAMNERELRQRRADLEALVDVGARLDDVSDPVLQARVVLDGLAARFGFERGAILGAVDGNVVVLASRGITEAPSSPGPADAVVARSWERRELVLVKRAEPGVEPIPERAHARRGQPARLADDRRRAAGRRHRRRASLADACSGSSAGSHRSWGSSRPSRRSTCEMPPCCDTSRTWPSATR